MKVTPEQEAIAKDLREKISALVRALDAKGASRLVNYGKRPDTFQRLRNLLIDRSCDLSLFYTEPPEPITLPIKK